MNEPFGRQPQRVTVTIKGDDLDVNHWFWRFTRAAEYKGDVVTVICPWSQGEATFAIDHRAVND